MLTDLLTQWGNERVNDVFEATLDPSLKPDESSSDRTVEKFIRDKYERKRFLAKKSRKPAVKESRRRRRARSQSYSESESSESTSSTTSSASESDSESSSSPSPVRRRRHGKEATSRRRSRLSRSKEKNKEKAKRGERKQRQKGKTTEPAGERYAPVAIIFSGR
jgi:hypothetical protein